MKKALLLCHTHNDLGLIRSLRKLGYYIISTGNKDDLIGQKFVDEFIKADYSDKDLILSIAKDKGIDAICQCCNDYAVYTASYVAEKLGLPGYDSYETTLLLHNKDKFKEFTKKYNIISPVSKGFDNYSDAIEYIQKCNSFPLIVKPVDASAGNGINRIDNPSEGSATVKLAFEKSKSKRIVVEPFIEGTQHGFCTFLKDQKVISYCSNNEYSIINKYRVEIDTYPSDNCVLVKDLLIEEIEKIARILHLKDGIFHLQYIFSEGKPYILEVMRRILGNMYSVPATLLTEFDWDYWETRAKCGLPLDSIPTQTCEEGYYAYKALLAGRNGILKRVIIPQRYDKHLIGKCLLHSPGYEITNYKSDPVGFMFLNFSSIGEMKTFLIDEYDNDAVKIMDND